MKKNIKTEETFLEWNDLLVLHNAYEKRKNKNSHKISCIQENITHNSSIFTSLLLLILYFCYCCISIRLEQWIWKRFQSRYFFFQWKSCIKYAPLLEHILMYFWCGTFHAHPIFYANEFSNTTTLDVTMPYAIWQHKKRGVDETITHTKFKRSSLDDFSPNFWI